jgi:hypothetical protein
VAISTQRVARKATQELRSRLVVVEATFNLGAGNYTAANAAEFSEALAARLMYAVVDDLPSLSLNNIRHLAGWLYYLHEHLGEEGRVSSEDIDPDTVPKHRKRIPLSPPVAGITATEPQAMAI